ncbi:hypothetical protein GCM10023317_27360 [Actinopolymorpha pittospori]|uniref:Zinc-binding dehydrogenase n=1 Tax=Actinopolymorpha pittospori TaxID=648752 RepID=A0A927MPR0_9ACTN|nr:hypothetical protein [Actinopolymorpha pittospori]MBE1603922.1 hypothetical protein [Actinopolymorpha pittospori]
MLRLATGEDLLVVGASGGVGSMAIQLGVAMGARVTAVASQVNHSFARPPPTPSRAVTTSTSPSCTGNAGSPAAAGPLEVVRPEVHSCVRGQASTNNPRWRMSPATG